MRRWLLLLVALTPQAARAGGIYVGESGSQAMERAGAFVARADDPTAISINPAGLAGAPRGEIYVGANLVNYALAFTRAGNYPTQERATQPSYVGDPYPEVDNQATFQAVPLVAGTFRTGNLAFGAGIFGPTAVGRREFPCDTDMCQKSDGAAAPQRYDIVKQSGLVAFPSLAVAYRVHPRLDLGVRASWGLASFSARSFGWGITNKGEDPLKDGDMEINVSDPFVPTFGAGMLFRPFDFLEIGAAYTSASIIHAKGSANTHLGSEVSPLGSVYLVPLPDSASHCAPGGTIVAVKTCMNVTLPQMLNVGARLKLRDRLGVERFDLEVDVKWENWARASDDVAIIDARDTVLGVNVQPVIARHGFQDVIDLRVGGSYRMDLGARALTFRGGVSHDTAAAPTSWMRLDKDSKERTLFAAGAAYDMERWRFDGGLAYVYEPTVVVKNVPIENPTFYNRVQPDVTQAAQTAYNQPYYPINGGRYESWYIVAMLGVTRGF